MTVLLGVSMGAHAVRMALPRNAAAIAAKTPSAPRQLFFKNQVIDTVDENVEYLAAESISALAAESEPSMATGVAYRDANQADALHRALGNQHLHNYHLVHEVEAVVEYLVASGEAAGYGTVALYDLGSSGLNVSVVDLLTRRVFVTRRSAEFSGDHFDSILRDNQLERLGKRRDAPDIELFTRRCRVAKERLSGSDAVCLPDASGMILLSRDSYEDLITDEVDRSIEFAREVMIGAQVPIDAVVLIGGGSRIPLVRKRVGPALELPALTPNEPESVAARGAALSARPVEEPVRTRPRPAFAAAGGVSPERVSSGGGPVDTLTREDYPLTMPPLVTTPAPPAVVPPPAASPPPAVVPPPVAPASSTKFALQNVYWLASDYEDDDGEDDAERRSRLVRSWSVAAVAAAAVVAVSGFLLTRPSDAPPVVDTAVTDAPSAPDAVTPDAPAAPVAPPPEVVPPPAPEVPPVGEVAENPAPAQPAPAPQSPEPQETEQAPVPQPPAQVPPPAPEPPPLIPAFPDFTLPTIPPLFPPAP